MIQIISVHDGTGTRPDHDREPGPLVGPGNGRGGGCVLNAGNEHLCVLSFDDGFPGNDDARLRIAAAAAGSGILMPEIEDKVVRMRAAHGGLLRIDPRALAVIRRLGGIRIEVLAGGQPVLKNQLVAELRLEPVPVEEESLARIEEACRRHRPVIDVQPCPRSRVGILTAAWPGSLHGARATVAAVQDSCRDLGCEIVFEIALHRCREADLAVIGQFIAHGTDLLIAIGFPPADTAFYAELNRAGGGLTLAGRSLAGTLVWRGHNDAVPVLWLPLSVLDDGKMVVERIVPRFLAGLADCRLEDGDECRKSNGRPVSSGSDDG